MFGGGSSQQQHSYQQHHHHHQPTQLTIASFLQKDILGENFISSCNSSSGGAGSTNQTSQSNNATINNYSDQQTTQHHFARAQGRYYNNYYHTPHYHQQQAPGQLHSCSYGNNNGTVDADLARFATNVGNQRPPAYNGSGYLNYNHTGSNNSLQYPSQMQPNQEQNRTRTPQSGYGSGGCDTGNAASKKSCSSASSCSSTSSSSSNSSSGSNRKQQQQQSSTQNSQQKQLSTLNLAIETLPPKTNGQQSGGQRQGHRGHHHHGHGNHHHQNHYGHHHHQLSNTPSTPQHQNYYNLTYVSTDGTSGATSASISGTNSRGCSPAPILPPTPSSSNPSPKSLENCPGAVAMMANLHLTTASTQINYSRYPQSSAVQQFQQQQYLNKKLLAPLTLSVPSPSPSPTPTHISGTLPPQASSLGPGPHNIICCSQLDEASTAAAAAAAKSGIIAGNDYDSDASSTHSSAVSNATQSRKYQTFKSLSISSSSSATSLCQQECKSQPGTPADVSASNTPLGSPMGYNSYASTFPNLQTSSTSGTQQTYLNHPHVLTKSSNATIAGTATQMPHVYNNGVISMLSLPSQSTASNCEGSCTNYMEEDYQQRQQPPHFFLGASSAQSSGEQLNIVSALSASTSRSNSSSGYWSPSHQCSFLYHQLSSSSSTSAPATSIMVAPHTPSCGSSSSSISPGLTDRDDHKSQQHLHKQMSSSGTSSPSITCSSCLNEQLGITPEGCSSTNSTSSNSSLSGRGNNNYATSSERG